MQPTETNASSLLDAAFLLGGFVKERICNSKKTKVNVENSAQFSCTFYFNVWADKCGNAGNSNANAIHPFFLPFIRFFPSLSYAQRPGEESNTQDIKM